ncbi:hypothetical protein PV332_38255 [Streptomyces scabiei]|nr:MULTISPECIES: hypothetical protein [Streptomyces]MDX2581279.1 hypothetical protein [Streptomyces scabiei]MDX2658924.1 hypothetical protein [Streptomyces scabiei]MDX2726665.1 hypothetical protein [Streptomyces scabiei]MDX2871852.1 hypothetical protein [Streptomyces scabiei]MDX2884349.1 hypothetical protein [Streptomyces scabiei]
MSSDNAAIDFFPIQLDDFCRPRDEITCALARWPGPDPELKVFGPVVEPVAVLVVGAFPRPESAAELVGQDLAVFEDPAMPIGVGTAWRGDPPEVVWGVHM